MTKEDFVSKVSSEETKKSLAVQDLDVYITVRSSRLPLRNLQTLIDTLIQTTMRIYEVEMVESHFEVFTQSQKTVNTIKVTLQETETKEEIPMPF